MNACMRMGWVRHGLTAWNKAGKIQGTTDIPLSAVGEMQAQRLADRLLREKGLWNGVVSSDLKRAAKTGQILSDRLGIPFLTDPRLKERSFGQAEGTTEAERIERWGPDWRRRVPDQETDGSVRERGLAFVEQFTASHPGENWLVVTHGSFLAQMLQALIADAGDGHIANLSLTVLERREDGWIPLLHNCTAHLRDDFHE
ncbi:histidine phosphatase family protein [Cohnella algarum]|uniref:histidine phosphatase family protein n=1 Tax=Cohnella algarum TaxID=2044859 RepID=UPI0019674E28|nr:histidine phosphatase family protein [Cohnella algarum]MBN2984293.1 histidine phosphatase family protein [Cohnella algarum]